MPNVPSGIIDQFLHPPLQSLTNLQDGNGPFGAGDHTFTTWDDSGTSRSVSDTFGVLVLLNGAIPPELSLSFGWLAPSGVFDGDTYLAAMAQVVVQHNLLLGLGGYVTSQIVECHQTGTLILWDVALPTRIGLHVAPNLSFDMQYLRAL